MDNNSVRLDDDVSEDESVADGSESRTAMTSSSSFSNEKSKAYEDFSEDTFEDTFTDNIRKVSTPLKTSSDDDCEINNLTEKIDQLSTPSKNLPTESESDAENDDLVTDIKMLKSPQEIRGLFSFNVTDTSLVAMNSLLLEADSYTEKIANFVPWHVNEDCLLLIDLESLKSRSDVTVDCWSWNLSKTYVSSSENVSGPFMKGNAVRQHRIIKRVYNCKEGDLKKELITRCLPEKNATNRKNPFSECERYAIIKYQFLSENKDIPHSAKTRIYQSVRDELKESIKSGKKPKKAVHEVTKQRGGILDAESSSHIPKLVQAYHISRNQTSIDPLQSLIKKQHKDGTTGDSFIQKIQTNSHSYDIVFFKERMIQNIANYCCTNLGKYKSVLCFDFTFDLGKSPPYYVLVTTFKNTTLLSKQTKKSPSMIGPLLICHKKDEVTVKMLCDSILDKCPGLKYNLKVIGSDCEKSLINQTCNAFPAALLLLCKRHLEENIKRNFPKEFDEGRKKAIFKQIFGSSLVNGLIDCNTLGKFEKKKEELYSSLSLDNPGKKFAKYFRQFKEEQIKYHAMHGVVEQCDLCDDTEYFYNNNIESLNSLIKKWQNFKKIDLFAFSKEINELVDCQETDVLRAYLNLDSPYEVKEEFKEYCKSFDLEYKGLPAEEKERVKKTFLNVIVEPINFKNVVKHKPGEVALQNVRKKLDSLLTPDPTYANKASELNVKEVSHECPIPEPKVSTINLTGDPISPVKVLETKTFPYDLDSLLFLFQEAMPEKEEIALKSLISKAIKIVLGDDIKTGFEDHSYFVKSYRQNHPPHSVVTLPESGIINCDKFCEMYQTEGFCSHCIVVSLKDNNVEHYASVLSRQASTNLTKIASTKVNPLFLPHVQSVVSLNQQDEFARSKYFYGKLNEIGQAHVVTLLSQCDKRVSVCSGCNGNLRDLLPPYDLIIVARARREYVSGGVKHVGSLSNCYFHFAVVNPYSTPFDCVFQKIVGFNPNGLKLHQAALQTFHQSHFKMLRDSGIFAL